MRARLIGLCAAACLAASACGPSDRLAGRVDAPAPSPAASIPSDRLLAATGATPAPSSTPEASARVRTLDGATPVANATGIRFRPSISVDRGHGITAGVDCLTPDGMAVTSVVKDVQNPDMGRGESNLELVDPGGATTRIPRLPGPRARQPESVGCGEHAVVWTEASGMMGRGLWTLFVYDRATGSTREIAADNSRDAVTWSGPFVAGERVYWAAGQLTGDEDRPTHSDIYSRDLAAHERVRREVSNARGALVHGNTMYYTKENAVDASVPEGRTEVFRRDLSTGRDSRVDGIGLGTDEQLTGLDFSGDELAWVIGKTSTPDHPAPLPSRLMIRTADGTTTTINGIDFGVPMITPSLVAWDANGDWTGDMWAYDRSRATILKLASAPGLDSVAASGDHLVWRDKAEWRFADLTPAG
jgi:hypothetical protein